MAKAQVKSKERVAEHGEVYTNEREVKAMCDLVSQECDRIDSRFLEPACGDGNFLAEVLSRKLETAKKLYKGNSYDYERYSVLAVTSIYGVDILQDNVNECRERMLGIWSKAYKAECKSEPTEDVKQAVAFILSRNILCGNALSLMCVDENQHDTDTPIVFPEWSMVKGTVFKRRDFRFDVLLNENDDEDNYMQFDLFGGATSNEYWEEDSITHEIIPKPIKEYKPVDYRKFSTMEE